MSGLKFSPHSAILLKANTIFTMANETIHLNVSTLLKKVHNLPPAALQKSSSYDGKTILLVVALCLIMLVGTVGNGFVCYFFGWKLRGTRSIPDRLFLYLGIVDLLSSLLNPATYLYFELTRYKRWDFGIVGCKILVPFGPISTLVSAFLIQIISIDRFFVIVKPFGRRYGSKCINISVLIAVALSVAFYAYYIIMLQVPPGKTCVIEYVTDERYSIPSVTFLLLQDVAFVLIIIITNTAIFLRLRKKDALSTSETGLQQSIRRKRKLFRMLMIMAIVFLCLILPKDLFHLSFNFSWMNAPGITYDYKLIQVNTILKILYTANSCANVFIYSKMHSRFRGSLKSLICLPFRRRLMLRSEEATRMPLNTLSSSEPGESNTRNARLVSNQSAD